VDPQDQDPQQVQEQELPRPVPTINPFENIDVETVGKDKSVETVKTSIRTLCPSWSATHSPISSNTGSPIVFNTLRKILMRWRQVASSRSFDNQQILNVCPIIITKQDQGQVWGIAVEAQR
jgi:hypothetical protein